MRRGLATLGSLLVLMATVAWAGLVEEAREAQVQTRLLRHSATKVAWVWELEVVSIAYRALDRLDRYMRSLSGGEMRNIVLDGLSLLEPYTRPEQGNLLIELVNVGVEYHASDLSRLLALDESLWSLGEKGTTLYLFIHLRVTDQWTRISKEEAGWIRVSHPARLALVAALCGEVEEAIRGAPYPIKVLEHLPQPPEGIRVVVDATDVGGQRFITVRVWEGGVLGRLDGLSQDLVCTRTLVLQVPG